MWGVKNRLQNNTNTVITSGNTLITGENTIITSANLITLRCNESVSSAQPQIREVYLPAEFTEGLGDPILFFQAVPERSTTILN